jgi:hypothetical protein
MGWKITWKTAEAQANRVAIWVTVYSALTALLGWLSSNMTALKGYGWADYVMSGLAAASVVTVVFSVGLVAWRFFRPLHPQVSDNNGFLLQENAAQPILLQDLARDLRAEIRVVTDAIAGVQQQIAIDLPNASTVAEAFRNLDDAVHIKVNRIDDEVAAIKSKNGAINWDLLRLLDWALNRASATVIKMLVSECPTINELECPQEEHIRSQQIDDAQAWIGRVVTHVQSSSFRFDILDSISNAKIDGEVTVKQLQPDQRPQDIDPYVFRDFFVVARQCNLVRKTLENVLKEIDNNELSRLQQLREQFSARRKQ